jgi:hypothetical protein
MRFHVKAAPFELIEKDVTTPVAGGHTIRYKSKSRIAVKVRLDFRFSSPHLASLAADGLTNPVALAWEVTPFSFLADYCVGLGSWLNRLDATLGKEFIGGSVTRFENFNGTSYTSFGGTTYGYQQSAYKYVRMQRSVYGSFPDASLIALNVKNPLDSAKRAFTGLSLLVQACKKR